MPRSWEIYSNPLRPSESHRFTILTAHNKASLARDAKAVSALYAQDATIIRRSDELLSGRATIEKMFAQSFEHLSPDASKLEHVAAIGNDMMLRVGSWSGTYQGHAGPVHLSGSWTTTDVRDGDTWKIHCETIFIETGFGRVPGSASCAVADFARGKAAKIEYGKR